MTVMLSSKSDSSCGVPVRGVSHACLSSYSSFNAFSSAVFKRSATVSDESTLASSTFDGSARALSGVVVVTVASGDVSVFDSSALVSACDCVTTGCWTSRIRKQNYSYLDAFSNFIQLTS